MDVVTLGAALNGSKKYTDTVAQSLMGGVRYQGEVDYYSDLPSNAEVGDAYTVKYSGTSGTDLDGTEYTWGLNHQTQQYSWIDFSKDSYTKTETNNLLAGKQGVIDSTHKLSADLVDDENSNNKFVTATEKQTWNGKQNAIDSTHKLSSDLVDDTNATNKFSTAAQLSQIATNASDIADIQDTIGKNTYMWYRGLISAIVNIPVKIDESTTRCYTPIENSTDGVSIVRVTTPDNMKCRVTFVNASGYMMNTESHKSWTNQHIEAEVPQGAVAFGVCVAFQDNKEITVADCKDVKIIKDNNEYILSKEFCGKKISILGDSISTFGGSADDDPSQRISDGTYTYAGNRCRYPQSNLLTNVSDTYWMRLIKRFGLILGINESWAGTRVSWDGTTESGDIGANKHIASTARIGHLGENGTPDIILINAGTNDIGNDVPIGTFNTESPVNYTDEQIAALPVATFADAYRTMLIRLQKSYHTSKIVVLLPNFTSTYYTPTKADEYCEIIKEACDYFGIKWIDMRASGITMFNRGTYLPDGIHYNAKGMYVVERNAEKFFNYNFTIR